MTSKFRLKLGRWGGRGNALDTAFHSSPKTCLQVPRRAGGQLWGPRGWGWGGPPFWGQWGVEGGFSSPILLPGCCPREGNPTGRTHMAAPSGARRLLPSAGPTLGQGSGDGAHPRHERTGTRCGDQRPESQTDFVGWSY